MAEILVLGGTGKTGRRLVQQLTAAGHAARPAARNGAVPFDWDDRTTWAGALDGADAVYVIPPALRDDYVPLVDAFARTARERGVHRAVLLSARGVDQAGPDNPLFASEQVLAGSGLAWTVLRPSWFMQNFSEGFFAPGAEGLIRVPAGDGAVAFVDCEDIAAVAAAALTQDGHAGQVYTLTGPEALRHDEVARVVADVAGRPVAYADAEPVAWQEGLVAAGVPAAYAAQLALLFSFIRAGAEAHPDDGVPRALGRPATPLRAWAERERAAFATAGAAAA